MSPERAKQGNLAQLRRGRRDDEEQNQSTQSCGSSLFGVERGRAIGEGGRYAGQAASNNLAGGQGSSHKTFWP